jgi:hypothetical protein
MYRSPAGEYLYLTLNLYRKGDLQYSGAGLDGLYDTRVKIHDIDGAIDHLINTLFE